MKTESELRQLIKDAGVQMLAENLVQGTWGNISVRIDEKHMLCTPSGLDYVDLTVDDMSVVDIDTLEWVGSKKPTSERKIHAAILRDRPEINVVLSRPLEEATEHLYRERLLGYYHQGTCRQGQSAHQANHPSHWSEESWTQYLGRKKGVVRS